MPRETFFNLSQEKKNKILTAAREEFTDNEFNKSRVSNIIKVADIPRGSFYQYFDDLEDLYFYVIGEMFDSIYEEGAKTALQTNDVFEFSLLTFDYDYKAFINDKRHRFMMNVLKSLSEYEEAINHFNEKTTTYIMSILNQMDLSSLRYKTQEELIKMYKFIQDTKRIVIRKSMLEHATVEEAKEEFKWYLKILKHGIIKE
jgi:AcrR family transcriptional regulator